MSTDKAVTEEAAILDEGEAILASKYLQSNSPRFEYISELKHTIEQLRSDLKSKCEKIEEQKRDNESIRREVE